MKKTHDEIPNEKWGLDRLGKFCIERRERSAMDTVLIGRAITLAKQRCKKEGKGFTDWKKEHGFSHASVSRYVRLAEGCKTDEDVERLGRSGPLAAYIEAGIEAPREHTPRKPSVKQSRAGTKSAVKKGEPKTPSWAVSDPEEPQVAQDDTEQTIDLIPIKVCVEHELREVVPWQVSHLKDKVDFLMEQDAEVLRAARPEKESDRRNIAAEIDALVELLSRLAATLRDEKQRKKKAA